jgi:hypothetical protein
VLNGGHLLELGHLGGESHNQLCCFFAGLHRC